MTFYRYVAAFLFLKEIKEIGCSFEVSLSPSCLSLNSKALFLVLFASKDPSLLHKSSKRRNDLKPENSETLSAISIKLTKSN